LNAAAMSVDELAICIDLGGTQVRAALIDRSGTIHKRTSEPTKAEEGPGIVTDQMSRLAIKVAEGVGRPAIAGAGICSPGPLDTAAGLALGVPTLAGFENFPLRDVLSAKLAMPVTLENDGICAAIGEWRFGAGKGFSNIVYVTVSTGIGGGVIIGNNVLRGRRGMAGHVGHMSFVQGGEPCACGNRGCFEAYASGTAFTRRAARAAAEDRGTSLGKNGQAVDAAAVFSAAAAGDALANRLVAQEAEYLGQGFASLLHLYSPDILIMGGGLSRQFNVLGYGIMASLRACAMPAFRDTPVMPASLGADSGLVGGAGLVFKAS
jgi:glucokinase